MLDINNHIDDCFKKLFFMLSLVYYIKTIYIENSKKLIRVPGF